MSRILVEALEPDSVDGLSTDAVELALLLAGEGHDVSVLASGAVNGLALPIIRRVTAGFDVAYLDVWTAEVDERVRVLRAGGARLSCLSDLLLERATIPTVGVTGTAGKSTTASFVAQLLRRADPSGCVFASATARAGNLWATAESLEVMDATSGVHVLELTSSHLAFMRTSPHVAVITSFWPDHIELHGSLTAYREAKAQIVRCQSATDHVVVNADDSAAAGFASETRATVHRFSLLGAVERGVFVSAGRVRAAPSGIDLGPAPAGPRGQAVLAAAAAVIASGVVPEALVGALTGLESPPGRALELGRRGEIRLIDDTMAATPRKTRAALQAEPPGTVVLVAGGELESAGRFVHASREEQTELARAIAEIRRVAKLAVCFGPAGEVVADAVGPETSTAVVVTIEEALAVALERAMGPVALVVSPMYPMRSADRTRVAELLLAARE